MTELGLSVAAVLLVSAVCSLFEAVLLSAPLGHIEKLAQDGNRSGQIFRKLRLSVDRPLSAILSLNTIANTGGAAFAGAAFMRWMGEAGEDYDAYFQACLTLAVLFFSEVIPKTIGAVFSRPLTAWIARPLLVLVWIFAPLIALCRLATRIVPRKEGQDDVSSDDILSLTRLGARTGGIEPDEARVIQNILSLKTKTAREVMTPRTVVFALQENMTVGEARGQSGTWAHSRIPVYAEDFEDVVGIVMRRDILAALAQDREQVQLSTLMRPVHFIIESSALDQILNTFLEQRQHLFIVIDEYGGLAGILSLEDVLEEILGKEIVDELDQVEDMRELARRRRRQTTERRQT